MTQTVDRPFSRWLPAVDWLCGYDRRWLRADVMAGVTLAAYLLPAGLADATASPRWRTWSIAFSEPARRLTDACPGDEAGGG